ncbi:MAG: ABC transporter permease [Myxococcota bacterium]
MLERWIEALLTLGRHRTRSAVTAATMAWGMFMLVILLGASTGLRNGAEFVFRDDASNSLWIYPSVTTQAHEGTPTGQTIRFDLDDITAIQRAIPEVEYITGRFYPPDELTIVCDGRKAVFPVRATHPDHRHLERTEVTQGRFLNAIDLARRRKVAVIGLEVAAHFFAGREALGQTLMIAGAPYRIVGVFDDIGGENERRMLYVPITTAQLVFAGGRRVDQIMLTVPESRISEGERVEAEVRRVLARRHGFSPSDPGAIRVRSMIEQAAEIRGVIDGIELFTWLVGLGTSLAGVVGVGNITLIGVQERTREFGVRRALGATGAQIVALVVREALTLTVLSGGAGLVLGASVLELLGPNLPANELFRDPRADLESLLVATAVLITAGALAGGAAAARASRLTPAEALRG